MSITVTPRALDVLRRALELGRLDPARVGVALKLVGAGTQVQTGFAEEAESDEATLEISGVRLFVPFALAERDATIDVADEHDRIIVR